MPSQFENLRKTLQNLEVQVKTDNWPQDDRYNLFFYEGLMGDHDFVDRLQALTTEIATTIPGSKMSGGAKSGGFTVIFNSEASRIEMLQTLDKRIDEVTTPAEPEKEDPRIKNWPFNPGWN